MEKPERIIVTGFMGSDRAGLGEKLAEEYGYELLFMDDEIEKKDGRPVKRICMLMGEHEYRNQEYELLQEFTKRDGIVVVCGDGILFDDMSREILEGEKTVIADNDKSVDWLWERAKDDKTIPYAFMKDPDPHRKYEIFCRLYLNRRHIYRKFV